MAFMGYIFLTFRDLPDWAIITIIILIITYVIIIVLYLLKKVSKIPCKVSLDDQGIKIELLSRSIFFPGKVFESSWSGISEVGSSYEPQRQNRFYKVSFSRPSITIYIDHTQKLEDPDEETEFGRLLMGYVALANQNLADGSAQRIDTRNFYQSGWARNVTIFVWIIMAGLFVFKIIYPDTIEFWRIAQFSIVAGIWLLAYRMNNRKKKT
jgi:hypothetical protein